MFFEELEEETRVEPEPVAEGLGSPKCRFLTGAGSANCPVYIHVYDYHVLRTSYGEDANVNVTKMTFWDITSNCPTYSKSIVDEEKMDLTRTVYDLVVVPFWSFSTVWTS